MRPLDDDQLDKLLSDSSKPKETRYSKYGVDPKTGKPSKVKFDWDDRTYNGWFKLVHIYGECEIAKHDETHSMTGLVAVLPDGRKCCRRCFLVGCDKL